MFYQDWVLILSLDEEKEFQLIQETVENYFSGVINGEYAKIVKAWHKDGNRILVNSDLQNIVFNNSPASSEYTNLIPDPELKQMAFLEAIDFTGNAACVRLKWFLESPHRVGSCTDYLLLLKRRKDWIIVSKVSHKE